MSEIKLTEKQRRFVDAYMGEAKGNGTEAARVAGYRGSDSTLGAVAHENLKKPKIAAAIQERVDADPMIATREDRQRFWTDTMKDTGEDMKHRLKASELLGKSQADFIDRHEVTAKTLTHEEALAALDPEKE
jgi:phage terminase small subunit